MQTQILTVADDFLNLRGSFKVGGLVDIGTQCSLVRLQSGRFALLDAYTLKGEVKEKILARTDGGRAIEAVLHLHPFHSIHVFVNRPLTVAVAFPPPSAIETFTSSTGA